MRFLIFFILMSSSLCYGDKCALVRELSDSFEESLKLNPPLFPIDINLARQQHENYIRLLEQLIPRVIRLEADSKHPDCNFIEDTALIVNDIAVISRMGALERRGEEIPVAQALKELGKTIISLRAPAKMDGGDLLYTGKHLFVGLSERTNKHALNQLKEIFQQHPMEVIGISVIESLHLKSVISLFDSKTLIVAACPAGKKIQQEIELATQNDYQFVSVPEPTAANVLRIGSSLIIQEGFSASEAILQDLCNQKLVTLHKINMSELIKADGALTCGSLLFNP